MGKRLKKTSFTLMDNFSIGKIKNQEDCKDFKNMKRRQQLDVHVS